MIKNFNQFLEQLSVTNATLDYFVDFEKVTRHIDKVKIKLNQLNYLLGRQNLKESITQLFEENQSVLPYLIYS